MGSFRIVTGSGYGRREVTDLQAVSREFSKLRQAAEKASHVTPRVQVKKSHPRGTGKVIKVYDKVWEDTIRKADKWAAETLAEFRKSVPEDTGNLKESLAITNRVVNKSSGYISITVGVDKEKILPPPDRMRRANGWMRTMPNYDYSPYVLGDRAPLYAGTAYGVTDVIGRGRANVGGRSITSTFRNIARKNAKKIMGE